MRAPHFPRRVSVADVVHNARCELYEAISQNIHDYPWIEQWSAGFNFAFVVDRHMDASADTTYLIPIQYGTFSLGIDASLQQNAKGTFVVDFSITNGLGRFREADCQKLREDAETPRRLLNGEIGLRRWLNEVIPQMEEAWIAPASEWEPEYKKARRRYAGKAEEISYTIEFGVTAEGSLMPSWNLIYPSGRQFRPVLDFSVSRIVTHKLIVALAPIVMPVPDLTDIYAVVGGRKVIVGRRVCVTNDDPLGRCWEGQESIKAEIDNARKRVRVAEREVSLARSRSKEVASEFAVAKSQADREKRLRELAAPGAEAERAERTVTQQLMEALSAKKATAERQVSETEKELEAAKAAEEASMRLEQERATAVRAARDQARAASEAATEQRLQQIIQQQIIRDAFRR